MPDAEGWSRPAVGEVPDGVPSKGAARVDTAIELDAELDLLDARVEEVADLVLRLREERAALAGERETLLRECGELRRELESFRRDHDALRREREETAGRLTQIIAKVDALRGEP